MHFQATTLVSLALAATSANAYWLMGSDFLTSQRIDPIVNPGQVANHVHAFGGGSNIGFNTTTEQLRKSECTSMPIKEDNSVYWAPKLYFQHKDGSFSSLGGGIVVYYLFPDTPGSVTAFPDNFRMVAGTQSLRSYDASSFAQQAVTFKCLDFKGTTVTYPELPVGKSCPDGIRAEINFPSCWNGKDMDSADHQSHVAYPSEGADKGKCLDPEFPVSLARIFMEVYWSGEMEGQKGDAMNPEQPYVLSNGDPTGYGYHADFFNGWQDGVLQKAADNCHCDIYGSPKCCADQGIFTYDDKEKCYITNSVDEEVSGKLAKLPGNNPVQQGPSAAKSMAVESVPGILSPVYVYHGQKPEKVGELVKGPSEVVHDGAPAPVNNGGNGAGVGITPSGDSLPSATPSPVTPAAPTSPANDTSDDAEDEDDAPSCDKAHAQKRRRSTPVNGHSAAIKRHRLSRSSVHHWEGPQH